MASKSKVVTVTQRRWISGISHTIDRAMRERIWIERLEARVLMAAGEFDMSFGVGGMARDERRAENQYHADRILPQTDGSLLVSITRTWRDGNDVGELAARISVGGEVDRSFGKNGLLQIRPPAKSLS